MFRRKSQPKVLMVEDNVNNHLMFRTAFEAAGFVVHICDTADGPFAEEVVTFAPDIISIDLMIGQSGAPAERDGYAAIALLKADPRTEPIPVMVLTNFSDPARVARAKELGVVDFHSLQGQSIKTIPQYFLSYLKNPGGYKPSHPNFRS